MNVREYLSVRRAYALVRQTMPSSGRITFEELAIMCHLSNADVSLRTSQIAEYQGVLRPTMTHRTSHLSGLGLIERTSGESDRRSVCCALSPEGAERLDWILSEMCGAIKSGMPLSRCTPSRMCRIVDAMGAISLSSADLVLLGLRSYGNDDRLAVCELVDRLGLLQPTVSMAVASLSESGKVTRDPGQSLSSRGPRVALAAAGAVRVGQLDEAIGNLHVRTPRRNRS